MDHLLIASLTVPLAGRPHRGSATRIDVADAQPPLASPSTARRRWPLAGPWRPVTVACMMVTDLRHYLDMPDDVPAPARRLGTHFAAIVRAASARSAGAGWRSAVGCTRRPGHRRCEGFVMVFLHLNGEIAWGCDSCGDEGVIRGWEGSPTDVSRPMTPTLRVT